MKTGMRITLLILFSTLLVFSIWNIFDIQRTYRVGQAAYSDLEQYVSSPVSVTVITPPPGIGGEKAPVEPSAPPPAEEKVKLDVDWPEVDFGQLTQINPEIIGWIYIKGTDINYPVVQADDNDYYLTRLFDGTYNDSGSIFLDASASPDFTDRHSIIFGHNMKNRTMFAQLLDYKLPGFYEEHPEILLMTPTQNYLIRIFSGHLADSRVDAWERSFESTSFSEWLQGISAQSTFDAEFQPQADDLIVSLSTCSYEYYEANYLVHGYIAYTEDVAPPENEEALPD